MSSRVPRGLFVAMLAGLLATAVGAATYDGRSVDDVWYEGRAVSTTYGAYRCQMKFHGESVYIRLTGSGLQIVGLLEDEIISDPHEIVVHDPKRGGYWTLDCFNLGR